MMGRIGIMGGTFDPIHKGHLMLGEQAYREYSLDEVWYMPSGQPPHKKDHKVTAACHRSAMTRLAIEKYPYFRFSDMEVDRNGNTYTAQTLRLLKETYPQHTFYFIIGADSLYEIETWYHPQEIFSLAIIVVARREYDDADVSLGRQIEQIKERYHGEILKLHCPQLTVASEQIRKLAGEDKPFSEYVPRVVEDYMKKYHLYQKETKDE